MESITSTTSVESDALFDSIMIVQRVNKDLAIAEFTHQFLFADDNI